MTATETTALILLEQVLLLAPPDLANRTRSAVLAAMDEGKQKTKKNVQKK